jgi:hypothetical protein
LLRGRPWRSASTNYPSQWISGYNYYIETIHVHDPIILAGSPLGWGYRKFPLLLKAVGEELEAIKQDKNQDRGEYIYWELDWKLMVVRYVL